MSTSMLFGWHDAYSCVPADPFAQRTAFLVIGPFKVSGTVGQLCFPGRLVVCPTMPLRPCVGVQSLVSLVLVIWQPVSHVLNG